MEQRLIIREKNFFSSITVLTPEKGNFSAFFAYSDNRDQLGGDAELAELKKVILIRRSRRFRSGASYHGKQEKNDT